MTYCVGTLSTEFGWETQSIENAANLHFYYWFVSREHQSKIIGKTPSFYAVWQRYGERREDMVSNTKEFLTKYMNELFPRVDVNVNYQNLEGYTSLYKLMVTVKIYQDNDIYDLSQIISIRPENFEVLEKWRLS